CHLFTFLNSIFFSLLIFLIHNFCMIFNFKIKIYNTFLYILSCFVFTILPTRYFPYLVMLTKYPTHIDRVIVIINLNNISSQTLLLNIVILFKNTKCNK